MRLLHNISERIYIMRVVFSMGSSRKQSSSRGILSCIILLIAGLGLMIFPEYFSQTVCYFLGVLALAFAASGIIKYFAFQASVFSLVAGFIALAIGLTLIYNHTGILNILPTTVGIFMLINGISEITSIYAYKRLMGGSVTSLMISACVTLAGGILLLVYRSQSVTITLRIIGGCLIYSALQGLFRALYVKIKSGKSDKKPRYKKTTDKNRPIEGTFTDTSDN